MQDLKDIDFGLIEGEVFDDLDNEAFLEQWTNPEQFSDFNLALPSDFNPFADLVGDEGSDGESYADEGETTEEEEDLPMPTPHGKSMLRRASVSSAVGSARPQIVRISDSNDSGPTLGSWVADPSRPICVIDGRKKTYIVPGGEYVFSESESEFSSAPSVYNPTVTGLTGGEGNFLDGNDILGPPEAFFPFIDHFGAQLEENVFNIDAEDGMDEFEADLQLEDFLDFSNDEGIEKEDVAGGDPARSNCMTFDGVCDDDDEEEGVKDRESSDAILSRWQKVSVTAFRKRQLQHNQKMAQSNSQDFGNPTPGAHKNRKGRLPDSITPGRKRRLKKKFLAGNSQDLGPGLPLGKEVAAGRGEELGWHPSNNKFAPLFEGL
ncbi:hypothetical protein RUND412_008353 [Rhizina undulata]